MSFFANMVIAKVYYSMLKFDLIFFKGLNDFLLKNKKVPEFESKGFTAFENTQGREAGKMRKTKYILM